VFAPLFSRPSSNRALKVEVRGRYSNTCQGMGALLASLIESGHADTEEG
jgi:hypothetical protein